MKPKQIKSGDIFQLNDGGSCTVVEHFSWDKILIRHNDSFAHTAIVESGNLRKGAVRNPYHPCVYGVGFIGVGPHSVRENGRKSPAYTQWSGIIQRGHSGIFKKENPSYDDVSVSPEWHNFQEFSDWFYKQAHSMSPGFQIDKDLMIIGNREYSPKACSFVPSQINSLLNDCAGRRGLLKQGVTFEKRRNSYVARISIKGRPMKIGRFPSENLAYSAYIEAKIRYVREMAEEYKLVLHPTVYDNLKNWKLD